MNPFPRGRTICHNDFAQLLRFRLELLHDLIIELSSARLSPQPIMHRTIERCRSPVKPLPPQPIVHEYSLHRVIELKHGLDLAV